MKISIKIDKETLLRAFQYKYAVIRSGDKYSWEFVPGKIAHANRMLDIPQDRIKDLTGMYV